MLAIPHLLFYYFFFNLDQPLASHNALVSIWIKAPAISKGVKSNVNLRRKGYGWKTDHRKRTDIHHNNKTKSEFLML